MKIIALISTLCVLSFVVSCTKKGEEGGATSTSQTANSGTAPVQPASVLPQTAKTEGGLVKEDLTVGNGAVAESGKRISVHYTGWLTNGTKFDSSKDRGEPFQIMLGAGQVIRGWDEGIVGMKVGGKRKLTIPSQMAYGERGVGPIPPNSTLVFEVELLKVE